MRLLKIKFRLFLIALFITVNACTTFQEKENSKEHSIIKVKPGISFSLEDSHNVGNIVIENISVDTVSDKNGSNGIFIEFDAEVKKSLLDSITKHGFPALYFEIICRTDSGLSYTSATEINKTKRIYTNRDRFFSSAGKRNISYFFPYRDLEMEAGIHNLEIFARAVPLRFKADTSSSQYRYPDKLSDSYIPALKLKVNIEAPPLLQAIIQVNGFKINTKVVNPSKYDFSVGGSGYPDPYWELFCGNDFVYYSPKEKNVIEFKKKFCTKPFYCGKSDMIKINFSDYDNGPFNNEDDLIETWSSRISELSLNKPDTFSFGKLEYLIVETKIIK